MAVRIAVVGRAVRQIRVSREMNVHGVLHPLSSKRGPAILDVPERSLQVLTMWQLLGHVHDFPVHGGFTDRSNLGGSLP